MKRALALVERDLPTVLSAMDRERFRDLLRLVARRFSVEARGGARNRRGEVTSCAFTPEFQELGIHIRTVWWSGWDSNPRPHACKACALPTELQPQRYKL